MSNTYPASAPDNPDLDGRTASSGGSGSGAKERAAEVKDTSVAAGQHVADVAKGELHKVGSESKRQAKDLYRQTKSELSDQAASQQKRVASGIRSLGDELGSMAESSESQGVATDLAQQAASRAAGIADWLEQRDPGSLLEEVKGFARRRPGTFIAVAAVAGVLAGRLTRSVIAESKESAENDTTTGVDTRTTGYGVQSGAGMPTGVGTSTGTGTGTGPSTGAGIPGGGTVPGVGTPLAAEYPDYRENRNE